MDELKDKWLAAITAGFIQGLTVFICYALVSTMIPNAFAEITRFGTGDPSLIAEGAPGVFSGHVLGPIIWTLVSFIVFFLATLMYRLAIKAFVSPDGMHPKVGLIVICCVFGFLSINSLLAFIVSQNILFAYTWLGMIVGTIVAVLSMRKIATPFLIEQYEPLTPRRSLKEIEVPDWAFEKARKASEQKNLK
jgi:hypothetical protein